MSDAKPAVSPFVPIVPPPNAFHQFNTGLGSEFGDTPKMVVDKINAGFSHVYSLLAQAGVEIKSAAAPVETGVEELRDWVASRFASITEHGKLADEIAKVKAAMEAAQPIEAAAKAEFDKLKADFDDVQKRFSTLAEKIEIFLGLRK